MHIPQASGEILRRLIVFGWRLTGFCLSRPIIQLSQYKSTFTDRNRVFDKNPVSLLSLLKISVPTDSPVRRTPLRTGYSAGTMLKLDDIIRNPFRWQGIAIE